MILGECGRDVMLIERFYADQIIGEVLDMMKDESGRGCGAGLTSS
jgi:hypothetical protein